MLPRALIGEKQKDPHPFRYNNPAAMSYAAWEKQYGETTGQGHTITSGNIAEFPDITHGMAANFALFERKYTGRTLTDAIGEWSGHHDVGTYLAVIKRETGLDSNTVITKEMWQTNQKLAISLMKAQSVQEAGNRKYADLPDLEWNAGYRLYQRGVV